MEKELFVFKPKNDVNYIYDMVFCIISFLFIILISYFIFDGKKYIIFIIIFFGIIYLIGIIRLIIAILFDTDRFIVQDDLIIFRNKYKQNKVKKIVNLYRIKELYRDYYRFEFFSEPNVTMPILAIDDQNYLIEILLKISQLKKELLKNENVFIIYKGTFEKEKKY
jgi:hypothetical protein